MKGNAGCGACFRHALQQARGIFLRGAELARKLQQRAAEGRCDAHEDAKLLAAAGFADQLVKLEIAIHHIVGHAIFLERDFCRAGLAHRRHEMAVRIGEAPTHKLNLMQRRGVEMADARAVNVVEYIGMRV